MSDIYKTQICGFCGFPNYENASSCESCGMLFPPANNEPDKKLTGDKEFKYICPFKFHDMKKKMFPQGKKISAEQPDDPDLTNLLVYEVFEVSDMRFTDFLEEIELDKIGLAPVKDQIYAKTWKNIEGNGEERFLLYPANDKSNRLYDSLGKDDDFPEELRTFDKSIYGEIGAILKQIENSDIYSYEQIGVRGFGDDKTYSYNIINDDYDEVIFTVRPCCPRCRTLLPDNWFSKAVHAYVPIALIASKASGKTTYMTSLLDPVFTDLLRGLGATEWQVVPAVKYEEKRLKIQSTRYENYKRLKEEGKYPIPTENVMPPVCLTIQKTENGNRSVSQIVVGIFDCKGELYDPKVHVSEADLKFLNSMQSFIYLVEPKQMRGIHYTLSSDKKFDPALIKSFDEQGRIQRENEGYTARGADIVRNLADSREIVDIFEMMVGINNNITNGNINLQHIAYTIVKSDELNNYKDDWDEVDGMDELLLPRAEERVLNKNSFEFIDEVVKEFFEKFVFDSKTSKDDMKFFESVGGENVSKSWHCVSVARELPKNEKINGRECEFSPVRITEPFVRCLVDKMKELGLIEW